MQALTRIYLRNTERLSGPGRALWLNLPGDAPWREWGAGGSTTLFCQDFSDWRAHRAAGAPAIFGDFPEPSEGPFDRIVLSLPRAKERLDMMTACLAACLAPDGALWVAGENRGGIRSAASRLRQYFAEVDVVDRARHCVLLRAANPAQGGIFEAARYAAHWHLETPAGALRVCSWPGVFAHGGLDEGTRCLLEALPELPPGTRVLDFGCGAGVIGAYLQRRQPALDLVLIDNDALACRAARETLAANRCSGQVLASDGFSEVSGAFDWVITNPPFHRSHRGDPSLAPTLLAPVRNFLRPRGQLILVANRHLPYLRWLADTFDRTRVLAANHRFQVIGCQS